MNTLKLGDLCEVVTKGTTPTTLGMKLNEGNVNFIKVECLSEDGQIVWEKIQKIDETTHSKLKRSQLKVGDILFSIAGSIGRMAIVTEDLLPANTNQAVAILRPKVDLVDTDFLFYFLRDAKSQGDARKRIVQSVQNNLSLGELANLSISLPSRTTQVAISSFMRVLDNKISLNRFISKTLEDLAQTIFKSWFVDFDPVRAKMAGEKPVGMDDATAELFPDSMEETDSGLIPKSWKYSLIENFAHVRYGAPFASKLFNGIGDGMPLIRIRDLKTQRVATWSAENHTKGFTVNGGQLLIGMDGEFNPTLWRGEEALVNQRICLLENRPGVSSLFLYFSLIPIMKRIENGAIGTTVIHLGKGDIDEICLLNPGTELLNIFEGLMKELLQEMVSLDGQSRNLLAIRDSLLPRLISGELQIPEEMLVS